MLGETTYFSHNFNDPFGTIKVEIDRNSSGNTKDQHLPSPNLVRMHPWYGGGECMKISAGLRGAPFRHGIAAFMAKLTHMDHIGTLHCCPLRAASFRHLYAPGFHSQFVEACVFFGAVLPHQGILPEDISSPNRLAALPSCFSGSPTCRHRKLKLGGLPSLEELLAHYGCMGMVLFTYMNGGTCMVNV